MILRFLVSAPQTHIHPNLELMHRGLELGVSHSEASKT